MTRFSLPPASCSLQRRVSSWQRSEGDHREEHAHTIAIPAAPSARVGGWRFAAQGAPAGALSLLLALAGPSCMAEPGQTAAGMTSSAAAQGSAGDPAAPQHGNTAGGASAPQLPKLPRSGRGARLPLDQNSLLCWRGIRTGVELASSASGGTDSASPRLDVRYTRAAQAASGVAFVLPRGAAADATAIELRIAASPRQRLLVCFTDAAGVVWTMPAISAGPEGIDVDAPAELFTLKFSDLKPDRWQNSGKAIPARPDQATFGMLTLLDITGFMGAPEEACRWRLDSAELIGSKPGEAPGGGSEAAGNGPPASARDAAQPGAGSSIPASPAAGGAADAGPPVASPFSEVAAPAKAPGGRRAAHDLFFEALQRSPGRRPEAIAALERLVAANPRDDRSTLLLGLAWLWTASDSSTAEPQRAAALRSAATHLDRAALLAPEDTRIPTWQLAARQRLALLEGRGADALAAREALRTLADRDPCFHSLSFAIMTWEEPRESPAFTDSVAFARRAMRCSGADSVSNGPRWPYGVQGFLVTAADLFARAGDVPAAEEALMVAESMPGFDRWAHREEVTGRLERLKERVAALADSDPANDPAFVSAAVSSTSCTLCHQVAR
jgi:hypothetical protein